MADHDFDAQAWLEAAADQHMLKDPAHPHQPLDARLPHEVVRTGVQPVVRDAGGVGLVEFSAVTRDGSEYATTRVVSH